MPADGMSAAAEKTGFRRPRRRLVDKTTPAAPGLKGAHDVSYWPKADMLTLGSDVRFWGEFNGPNGWPAS